MRIVRYSYPTQRFALANRPSGQSPWTGLESEIDRLFATALTGFGGARPSGSHFPVDIFEDKENTFVRAELPGVSREDVNVEMVEGYLTITAARKQKSGNAEEALSFSRSIAIPEEVQADKVSAAYENGVLTVTLPKREEAKPKKVSVEVR